VRGEIPVGDVSARFWVLSDARGPVDLSAADVTRTVVAEPQGAPVPVVADAPCTVSGLGRVRVVPTGAEVASARWLGFRFRARWGPGEELWFPSEGFRWVEVR
jgi:hypothetical protein